MADIFISYAHEDRSTVLEIYKTLNDKGFSLWIDHNDLLPGQDWKVEIEKAIQESEIFIACLSSHSVNKRGYVQAELKRALDIAEQMPEGSVYIIPVRLDDCKVPITLDRLHWLDYFVEDQKEKLLKVIQKRVQPSKRNISKKPLSTNRRIDDVENDSIEDERFFDAGDQVKTVRNELGLSTSEFAELLGVRSQTQYASMESRIVEFPLSVLRKVSEVSSVSLDWLKHASEPRYKVGRVYLNPVEDDLRNCASLNPQKYYLTIDKKQLHMGLVLQTAKYQFQVMETGVHLDFWNWVDELWAISAFYNLLIGISSQSKRTIMTVFLPTRFDKRLYEGNIHFLFSLNNSEMITPGFLYDLLDIDQHTNSPSPHSKFYGINSFDRIQEYFKEYIERKKEREISKLVPEAKSPAAINNPEKELTQVLLGTYQSARKRGYVATYFLQMLEEHGGVETAKRLLSNSEAQTGLFELWERGLLKESMEAVVLQDKFKVLFTAAELAVAHQRLEELGYFKKG
jgi:transcriptional regulator with XRE-family HTH domain